MIIDKNGKELYDTKKYYQNLAKENQGLAKAFFKKEEVGKIDTNYIGHLGKDQNGRNTREFDKQFSEKYKLEFFKNRDLDRLKNKSNEDKFRSSLRDNTQDTSIYQNWCDNFSIREDFKKEVEDNKGAR